MSYTSYFHACRDSVYNSDTKEYLISEFSGSEQEKDLSLPPNCNGYGRIRHFKRFIDKDWGLDPLPIDPAIKALNLSFCDTIEAQVFQIASCNVNCWYCFVPNALKCADGTKAKWISASAMVDLFDIEESNIRVIDLSGGNPELVPEWIIDTMRALVDKNLEDRVYLWSDDTLTTDYTFKFLSHNELNFMKSYKTYGKVCCFKGFDAGSFSFNTKLPEDFYEKQFQYFSRYPRDKGLFPGSAIAKMNKNNIVVIFYKLAITAHTLNNLPDYSPALQFQYWMSKSLVTFYVYRFIIFILNKV